MYYLGGVLFIGSFFLCADLIPVSAPGSHRSFDETRPATYSPPEGITACNWREPAPVSYSGTRSATSLWKDAAFSKPPAPPLRPPPCPTPLPAPPNRRPGPPDPADQSRLALHTPTRSKLRMLPPLTTASSSASSFPAPTRAYPGTTSRTGAMNFSPPTAACLKPRPLREVSASSSTSEEP
jgi:hypothetical protein